MWVVDSGATDHVARDEVGFVEYCWLLVESKKMFMGNHSSVDGLGIGTYTLVMQGGRALTFMMLFMLQRSDRIFFCSCYA